MNNININIQPLKPKPKPKKKRKKRIAKGTGSSKIKDNEIRSADESDDGSLVDFVVNNASFDANGNNDSESEFNYDEEIQALKMDHKHRRRVKHRNKNDSLLMSESSSEFDFGSDFGSFTKRSLPPLSNSTNRAGVHVICDLKPLCKYGQKCYRKNDSHFEEFAHPWRSDDMTHALK